MLKRLLGLDRESGNTESNAVKSDKGPLINVYIKCQKCGEPIHLRIRKSDELQREYDSTDFTFFVQKNVIGNKCYNRMPVRLELDAAYKVIKTSITGGVYISEKEYKDLTKDNKVI